MMDLKIWFGKLVSISLLALMSVVGLGLLASTSGGVGARQDENSLLGNYLAGRFAHSQRDLQTAAEFYKKALAQDPGNKVILEQSFLLELTNGNWKLVESLAKKLIKYQPSHQIARLYLATKAFKKKDYRRADLHFLAVGKGPIVELTTSLARAWVFFAQGKSQEAVKILSARGEIEWITFFKTYHRALISDLSGQHDQAGAAFSKIFQRNAQALRVASAYIRHASNARKRDLAERLIKIHLRKRTEHAEIKQLSHMIATKKTPERIVRTAQEGLAEVFYGLGDVLSNEGGADIGEIYLQLAIFLRHDFPHAQAVLANLYEASKEYKKALKVYSSITEQSPLWQSVQIRKAFTLDTLERVDEAEKLLIELTRKQPDEIPAFDALGDILRSHKHYKKAEKYYSRAIKLIEKPEKRHWRHYYSRGVCYERMKEWPKAEADLLKALDLHPDEPLILNYLGYSWVDQNIHLKRAIALIHKAVQIKPDDGYFVDSLGWAHYRLGDFQKAVEQLERAVELKPDDPVINDHLGDAYWRIERKFEAHYQWEQSLSLKPEPEDLAKTKKKLKDGLQDPSTSKTVSRPDDKEQKSSQ